MHRRMIGALLGIVTLGGARDGAWGQEAVSASDAAPRPGSPLEEIVITARKTAENLQDVDIAVTAITPEIMEENVLRDVSHLQRITPSLNYTQSPGQAINPAVVLRGQVQNDPSVLTLDPSVGVYLDEVYLGRSPGSLLDLFDIERVEVLKGPQGTLYGRNTTGGAIRIIPAKAVPGGGWTGFLRSGGGNVGARQAEGALNVPALESLAFRLSGSYRAHDGWGKQLVTDPDQPDQIIGSRPINDKESLTGRLSGIWNVVDDLAVEVGADYADQDTGGATSYEAAGDLPVLLTPLGPITTFVRSSDDFYTFASDIPLKSDATTSGFYLKGTYELWGVTAKLIHSRRHLDYAYHIDPDGTGARGIDYENEQDVDQDSTEIQLLGEVVPPFGVRLSYVIGLYDFTESGHDLVNLFASEIILPALGIQPPVGSGVPPGALPVVDMRDARAFVKNQSRSAFFQLNYEVTEWLGFTGGVRYIQDIKRLQRAVLDRGLANQVPGFGFGLAPGGTPNCLFDPSASGVTNDGTECVFDRTDDFRYLTYTAGINLRPDENLLFYLKTSRGARSGGQQVRGTDSQTLTPFDPEFVQDVELGAKSDLLDGRLRANLALYRTSYTDFQFSDVVRVSTVVQNIGDARIYGAELETSFALTDRLTLHGSGSFLDFRYLDQGPAVPGPLGPIPPTQLINPYAPKWQLSPSVGYRQPLAFGELGGTVGYSYKSFTALDNDRLGVRANPHRREDGYGILQVSTFATWDRYHLRAGLFVTNLTDEEYKIYVVPSLTKASAAEGGVINTGAPRLFGGEIVWTF